MNVDLLWLTPADIIPCGLTNRLFDVKINPIYYPPLISADSVVYSKSTYQEGINGIISMDQPIKTSVKYFRLISVINQHFS